MKKVLFPGTFSPPTLGHLDIIQRAAKICETLYVGIAHNPRKNNQLFSADEKMNMLKQITKSIPNIEVVSFSELVIDFIKKRNINCLVRGLRAFSDFDYEFQMALANRKMSEIETLFFMTDSNYAHISSSLIHEIATFGHRLHGFVPDEIEDLVFQRIASDARRC